MAAVASLAIGIGGCVAIYTGVKGIYFSQLPYEDADRLVSLESAHTGSGRVGGTVSLPDVEDWKRAVEGLEDIAVYTTGTADLTGEGFPVRIRVAHASANFLSILGVGLQQGRDFDTIRNSQSGLSEVVLTAGFWRARYAAANDIRGSEITIDGVPHLVVGIVSEDFVFPGRSDVDLLLSYDALNANALGDRSQRDARAIGKLHADYSIQNVQQELSALAQSLAEAYPATNDNWTAEIEPLRQFIFPSADLKAAISVASLAIAVLLLVICANVASLCLARANARRGELGLRVALGADRGRLIGELMVEYSLLAGAGGLLGIGLSWVGMRLISLSIPVEVPAVIDLGIDGTVLVFTLFICTATTLVFGLVPAIKGTSHLASASGREGGNRFSRSSRWDRLIVTSQISFVFVLLTSASSLTLGSIRLNTMELGFDSENLVTMTIAPPERRYNNDDEIGVLYEILDGIHRLPNVEAAALTSSLTLTGADNKAAVEITPEIDSRGRPVVSLRIVSSRFFETLMLGGRSFDESDRESRAPVAVVTKRSLVDSSATSGSDVRFWGRAASRWSECMTSMKSEWTGPLTPLYISPHRRHGQETWVSSSGCEAAARHWEPSFNRRFRWSIRNCLYTRYDRWKIGWTGRRGFSG